MTINPPPTARSPRFREKISTVILQVGGFSAGFPVSQLSKPQSNAFVFGEEKPFTVYMEDDTLYVDVKIPGPPPGAQVIEIKHNEFSQPPFGWDRNFDESALEFVNQSGVPVFQLIYGTARATIRGIFSLGNGALLVANETSFQIGRFGPTRPIIPPQAIFKYPSALHLGERVPK